MNPPTPIVLCAFGTTASDARGVFDIFEQSVRSRFAGHDVRWAITSSLVRRALTQQGVAAKSPLEALAGLRQAGFSNVAVQPLLVTAGQEFEQLDAIEIPDLRIVVGRPLLDAPADYDLVLDALASEVRADVPNVFIIHGNENRPEANKVNFEFSMRMRSRFANAVLASLEGEPGVQPLDTIRLATARAGGVHFIPLLFTFGQHMQKDVLGDAPSSWKNRMNAQNVTSSPPLAENAKIIEIYLDHLEAALAKPG